MKKRDVIALVLSAIVILIMGSVVIKTKLVTSRERLAANITQSVENQDSKLFLKQFDKESKVSRFADIGAKAVLKDWRKHATISDKEIAQRVLTGKFVTGADYDYHFALQEQTKFLFFKDYYLSASLTRLKPDANAKKATITVNKEKFKQSDFNDEFFPGTYKFISKLQVAGYKYTNDYDWTVTGDPASFTFDFDFDGDGVSSDAPDTDDNTDSQDDDQPGDTDKAYATMNDSEYESRADDIGDSLDKTYGNEQKNYSSYDDSQYPDYQGNTK